MQIAKSNSPLIGRLDLFILSALSLFLELLIIRWLASEIRAFTIFKNFPLVACYVGLGLGFMLSDKNAKLFKLFPSLLFLLIFVIVNTDRFGLARILMPGLAWGGLETAWFDISRVDPTASSSLTFYIIFSLLVFFGLFALIVGTTAGLGQRLGQLFDQRAPLQSYLINLLGAIVGILGFSLLSFNCTPPIAWITTCCLIAIWIFRLDKLNIAILLAVIALAVFIPPKNIFAGEADPNKQVLWSPYHRIDIAPYYIDLGNKKECQAGYQISANKGYFQQALNLSDASPILQPGPSTKNILDFRLDQYEFPYLFCHPKSVLIMGCGTGNDVAAALRHGVEHIDAVEIDPMILKLGYKLHPEHPYDSPKVHTEVNDARAFLRKNNTKYDLVMTGFLDSHTVSGNSLSVRLDDYVYTVEGMQDALSHLNPNGLYSITYCAANEVLPKRLVANMRIAAHSNASDNLLVLRKSNGQIWHLLSPVNDQIKTSLPKLALSSYEDCSKLDTTGVRPSTDDWPFLYLKPIVIDPLYLSINICVILFSWAVCGTSIRKNGSPKRWQLFFLGAAFLLLELAVIDRLALVFGNTWLVNSFCIFAVLLAVTVANIVVIKFQSSISLKFTYIGLLLSLLLVYFIPLQSLNLLGMWLGGSIASLISILPVFFAGLIFSSAFAQESKPSTGLAFNMFGAMMGGLLEYIVTYTGIRGLLLVALLLYSISWIIWNAATSAKGSTTPA